MHDQRATDRLTGLALAGVVVAILAVGLAVGQNDWHDALVIVGALLQVTAILYATRLIWLALIASWRSPRPAGDTAPAPAPAESPRTGLIPLFSITPDDALVAGAMAIAGIVLTAVGNLV